MRSPRTFHSLCGWVCLLHVAGMSGASAQVRSRPQLVSRGVTLSLSGNTIAEPILFLPGDDRDEMAAPQKTSVVGFSVGYEWMFRRGGIDIGLDYLSAPLSTFVQPAGEDNFLTEVYGPTTYRKPNYTLWLADFNFMLFPFQGIPLAVTGIFDLGMSWESYFLVKSDEVPSWFIGNEAYGSQSKAHGQVGFGLGLRAVASRNLRAFVKYTWLIGEGKPQYKFDHEDEHYYYFKSDGYDLKGPTKVMSFGVVFLIPKHRN